MCTPYVEQVTRQRVSGVTPGQWTGMLPWDEHGWVQIAAPSSPLWLALPVFWHTAPKAALRNLKYTNAHLEHNLVNSWKLPQRPKGVLQVTSNFSCYRTWHQKPKVLFVRILLCLLILHLPAETDICTHTGTPPRLWCEIPNVRSHRVNWCCVEAAGRDWG